MPWVEDSSAPVETYRHGDGLSLRWGRESWSLLVWRLPLGTGIITTLQLDPKLAEASGLAALAALAEKELDTRQEGDTVPCAATNRSWTLRYDESIDGVDGSGGWVWLDGSGGSYNPGVAQRKHPLVAYLRLQDQTRRYWGPSTTQLAHDASPWKDEETGAGTPTVQPAAEEVLADALKAETRRGWQTLQDGRAYRQVGDTHWAIITVADIDDGVRFGLWALYRDGCHVLDVGTGHTDTVEQRTAWGDAYIATVHSAKWAISSDGTALYIDFTGALTWTISKVAGSIWALHCNGKRLSDIVPGHTGTARQRIEWADEHIQQLEAMQREDGAADAQESAINPSHYKDRDVSECIDIVRAITWDPEEVACAVAANLGDGAAPDTKSVAFADHCRLDAFKYVFRAGDKVLPGENVHDAIVRDLGKAVWYLQKALHELGAGDDPRDGT